LPFAREDLTVFAIEVDPWGSVDFRQAYDDLIVLERNFCEQALRESVGYLSGTLA
jgi:hypothetical protein